jgi:hypothetical protein
MPNSTSPVFEEHQKVRVRRLLDPSMSYLPGYFADDRGPRVGDLGFVVDFVVTPTAIPCTVDGIDFEAGRAIWLASFSAEELEAA